MTVKLDIIREPDEFCRPCGMYKQCETPIMNGEGSDDPIWSFIGEAPGGEEDDEGYPFIGESGQLLREMIEAIGIDLQKCRFSNVVRCRPADNDLTKFPNAIDHCRPHILREIRATNPKVVVLLGNSAIESILHKRGITRLNAQVFRAHGRDYVCGVHPAYVLRNKNPQTTAMLRDALLLASNLGKPKKHKGKEFSHEYIRDRKMLQEYVDMLKKKTFLTTDIEGSTLSPHNKEIKPQIACVGFAWDIRSAVCFPVQGRVGVKVTVSPEEVMEAVGELWTDPDIKFALHFGKYDYVYTAVLHKIRIKNYWMDTGLGSYALNVYKGGHGLKDWAWKLGMGGYELEMRTFQRENKIMDPEEGGNMVYIPAKILYPYNMNDCIADFRLALYLYKKLKKENLWNHPFKFPLMYHLWTAAQMEITGLKLDLKRNGELLEEYPKIVKGKEDKLRTFPEVKELEQIRLRELIKETAERVHSYKRPVANPKERILELVKRHREPVNLNSTDNKRELVFEIMDREPLWDTPSGDNPSTEREVLEKLNAKKKSKVITLLLQMGEYSTSYSKYIKPIQKWAGLDGRTHTTYRPSGQVTGRVSSADPNHENLPKRGRLANILRSQFVPTNDDYFLMASDEKQIEMRLFADRAKDDMMIEEFNAGKDPHRMGAAIGFGVSESKVTKEQRTASKSMISFGLLYGRGAPALAADMGWSIRRAEKFISDYFGKYDDCYAYRQEVEEFVRKHKYVLSYFGRRRWLLGVDSDEDKIVHEALRQAVNTPIQGDASDITWSAAWRMSKWLQKYRMKSKVVIVIHDDITMDVYRKEAQDVLEMKYKFMTDRKWIEKMTGWFCEIPFDIDVSVGRSLGAMKELERKGKSEFILPTDLVA